MAAMLLLADPISTLNSLGIKPSPDQLLALKIAALVVPVLVVGGVFAYKWWQERKANPPSAVDPSQAGSVAGAQVSPNQLRNAWRRFLKNLPPSYERSILNFEHFVVLGAAASGKSRVIDAFSDWRRQAKQLPGSQSHDADLPTYLASGIVITELPARFLADHSTRCLTALRNLWAPLYKNRAPTVVVVVDVDQIKQGTPESVVELAESVRAKINLLSQIRKKPIEVRVVLTHVDTVPGYAEFARFCRDQSIALKLDFKASDGEGTSAQLNEWFDGMREHLPRVLTKSTPSDYLKIVAFLRKTPELTPSVAKFLSSLFTHEVLSRDPIAGGVFLAAEAAGVANPLERAAERGPGPDPRRRHLIATAAVASAFVAYFLAAFYEQNALVKAADEAIAAYDPASRIYDRELRARLDICKFTGGKPSWIERHPDFYEKRRIALRKAFSDKVRMALLLPRLNEIGQKGTTEENSLALPTRRSLYMLALIHSDKRDELRILDPGNLAVWVEMTGLKPDLIQHYIENTDEAWKIPVSVEQVSPLDVDLPSTWKIWTDFLSRLESIINASAIAPDELQKLQRRALELERQLDRYRHDTRTAALLKQLDAAAGTTAVGQAEPPLEHTYGPKYRDYIRWEGTFRIHENEQELKAILSTVRTGIIDAQGRPMLSQLTTALSALYDSDAGGAAADQPRTLTIDATEYTFDPKKWRAMLRDSQGKELVLQFVRASAQTPSIFFGPEQDKELRPILWNTANDGIFTGRGALEARYTKSAYDTYVRGVVLKLAEALDKAKIPTDTRKILEDLIRSQVRKYAGEYRQQITNFVQGYKLQIVSPEALRVALTQMVTPEKSVFNDYLTIVEQNTQIDIDNPLLDSMRDVNFDFGPWHNIVVGEAGTPDILKYRAIITPLLADLGPAEGAAPAADASGQPMTLEKELTPVGRLVLGEVKGDKASYGQMATSWLQGLRVPDYQRNAFSAPFVALSRLGRIDIERALQRAWEQELLPEVRAVASRFPFNDTAKEDVTPGELTNLFHPQTGRYFDVFRRYFEPISDFGNGGPFRAKPGLRGRLTVPAHLYELTNTVASLSARLWDSTGKPIPLSVRVATVPFEHGPNPRLALTLVYVNTSTASLFNFNQKPTEVAMILDWTKEYTSQVGLQLTDIETKENVFPDPIGTDSSFWSFLRLLKKGEPTSVKYPPGAQLHTWTFKLVREKTETMRAQFVTVEDLWSLFAVGPFVHRYLTQQPVAGP